MARTARREVPYQGSGRTDLIGGCNTDALGINRVPASCRCIGSECAMWRWNPKVEFHPSLDRMAMPGGAPARGHCGLAGRPEVAP